MRGAARFLPLIALLSVGACGARDRPGGAGGLLTTGSEAPDFMAQDQDGRVRQLRLVARDRPAVLFFYPRDGTPGCTREACAFRDSWHRLQASGAVVIGVSSDSVESHAEFAQEHDLPFILLSDPHQQVMRTYGVPDRLGMAARITFVIDGNGRIARVFEDVDPAVHVDEVLAVLEALPRHPE